MDERDYSELSRDELAAALRLAARRRAELESLNARLSALFALTPTALLLLDRDGAIEHANPAAAALVAPDQALRGRLLAAALPLESRAALRGLFRRVLDGSGSRSAVLFLSGRRVQAVVGREAGGFHVAMNVVPGRSSDAQTGNGASSRAERWISERMTAWGKTIDLSPSEMQVAELLLVGLANKEIAARRGVSLSTVRTQVSGLFRKAGVASRSELSLRFFDAAITELDPG